MLGRDHLILETSARGRAEDHLSGVFAHHQLQVRRSEPRLRFQHHRAGFGALDVHHLAYGAEVTIRTPALPDFYLLQLTLSGSCRISDGARCVELPTGSVFVMNPGRAYEKDWGADSSQLILRIERSALERRARQDRGVDRAVVFDFAPADPAAGDAIARALHYLCHDLAAAQGGLRDLGPQVGFTDLLLSLLLARLRTDRARTAASGAAPYYVRRAEMFVRGHAGEDIRLSDIAEACGVNCRTLNAGFRRFRDTTPMSFLRDVRLDRARLILQRGEPGATVTGAALACNLQHLGRFAQAYAERFGESPSDTLRSAFRLQPH